MKNKLSFLDKIKVQKKLYMIFFITVFIPVITVGSYLVYNTRSLLKRHYTEQVHSDVSRIRSQLLDLTTNVYSQANTIAGNDALAKLLCEKQKAYEEGAFRIREHEVFSPLLTENGSIQYISVYTYNTNLPEGKYIHPITDEIKQQSWYQRAAESVATFWSQEVYTDDFGNPMTALCLHSRIFLPEIQSYALLTLTVNHNYIKNRLESAELKTLLLLNDEIFYSTDTDPAKVKVEDYVTETSKEYTGIVQFGQKTAIACVSTLDSTQYEDVFYVISEDDEALPYLNKITIFYCLILALIIFVASVFIYVFSAYFSKRINTLRTAMHNASTGNYQVVDSFQGTDEISDVFADMNKMVRTILRKEESIYRAQLQTQELTAKQWQMEFKMLSSQINSHFLYNTLETIRMRSLKAGNRDVANATKLLGKCMRYALENTITSYTTIDKELDYIEAYLSIQKLRFRDRINYSLRVQPGIAVESYPMLPLLLQPIVENAAIHGLEEVEENGKIIIHITKKEQLMYIDIFDNGSGMSEEELEQMREKVYHHPQNSSKSIGLHNIYQRIQLCYGEEYGMTIRSRQRRGTLVRVTLPAEPPEHGMENKNEIVDRR